MAALTLLLPDAAEAKRSATCRRIDAEARASAALLFAPSIRAQALRLPAGGTLDEEAGVEGFQARGALSFSAVDLWRGADVLGAADADCDRSVAAERLGAALRDAPSHGRHAALDAQLAFLDERLPRAAELVAEGEARLERGLTTLADLEALRRARLRLLRKRATAAHDRAVLGDAPELSTLGADLARYETAMLRADERRSHLRRLSAFDLQVDVGVAAGDQAEWFGIVSLTYDLGQLWQARAERRALDARRDELAEADGELRAGVARFREAMAASATQLRAEVELVEAELTGARAAIDELRKSESGGVRDRLAQAELELIDLEADLVYLTRLLAAREALEP